MALQSVFLCAALPKLTPNTWTAIKPVGLNPGIGGDVHFTFDPISGRVFNFFGDLYWDDRYVEQFGSAGAGYRRTVLAYDVAENTWSVELPDDDPTAPHGRCQPGVAYDAGRRLFYIWGGVSSRTSDRLWGGLLSYDPLKKKYLSLDAADPPNIVYGGDPKRYIAYDGLNDRVLLVTLNDNYYTSVWAWTYDDGWTQLTIEGPKPYLHTDNMDMPVVMAEKANKLVFVGQIRDEARTYPTEGWSFDLKTDTWTAHSMPQALNASRIYHRLTYDSQTDTVFLFGGDVDGVGFMNDLWALESSTDTWSLISTSNTPPPRRQHGFTYDSVNNVLVVWGAADGGVAAMADPKVWIMRYASCTIGDTQACTTNRCALGNRTCLPAGGYGACVATDPSGVGCGDEDGGAISGDGAFTSTDGGPISSEGDASPADGGPSMVGNVGCACANSGWNSTSGSSLWLMAVLFMSFCARQRSVHRF